MVICIDCYHQTSCSPTGLSPKPSELPRPCLDQITSLQPLLPSLCMGLHWMQPNLPSTFTSLCFSAFPTTPTLRNNLLNLILQSYHGHMLYTNSINRQSWLRERLYPLGLLIQSPRLLIANHLKPVATCPNIYSVHVPLKGSRWP